MTPSDRPTRERIAALDHLELERLAEWLSEWPEFDERGKETARPISRTTFAALMASALGDEQSLKRAFYELEAKVFDLETALGNERLEADRLRTALESAHEMLYENDMCLCEPEHEIPERNLTTLPVLCDAAAALGGNR